MRHLGESWGDVQQHLPIDIVDARKIEQVAEILRLRDFTASSRLLDQLALQVRDGLNPRKDQ